MKELEKVVPGAIQMVGRAQQNIARELRNAKQRVGYKRGQELLKQIKASNVVASKEELSSIGWLPSRVPSLKELEHEAAHYGKDPEGKFQLQVNIENVLGLEKDLERQLALKNGYVTYYQIQMLAEHFGIDTSEIVSYSFYQMRHLLHEFFRTTDKLEKMEFGYVDLEKR